MRKQIAFYFFILLCGLCLNACGNERPKPKPKAKIHEKPTYNIYVENSGSMDGFVKEASTNFQNTVYQFLLNGVEGNHLANRVTRNFIVNDCIKDFNKDTDHYLKNLTPTVFKQFRGASKSSEISTMLQTILAKSTDKSLTIWVSDCDFYPGDDKTASKYLQQEKIKINSIFKKITDKGDNSTVVLQLLSDFDGEYYKKHIKHDRPYYIWIVGKTQFIEELFQKVLISSFEGGGVKGFYCLTNNKTPVKYIILGAPNYRLDTSNPKTQIINAKPVQAGPNKGKFQFSIGLNLKGSLLGVEDSYVLDKVNYSIESASNYQIEIKRNESGKGTYTHILKLTAPSLKSDNVIIRLTNKIPRWVNDINSINAGPLTDSTKFKTFGIETLIEGVKEAYDSKPLFEINISVKLN